LKKGKHNRPALNSLWYIIKFFKFQTYDVWMRWSCYKFIWGWCRVIWWYASPRSWSGRQILILLF